MNEGCYIQVIVPLRLEWIPWYRAPRALAPGTRVAVFFAHRTYTGVVLQCAESPGIDKSKVQDIICIHEELAPVSQEELRFWEFLSTYYLCTLGEVYKAAYPAGKILSEQKAANILERLRQRLAVREEALAKKHKDSVRERLEAERDSIAAQIEAMTRIPDGRTDKPGSAPGKPVLLTGGDRTGEYLRLCKEAIAKGLNALVLTPEIAAGEQLAAIFEDAFPGQVHGVNSHITETRRRRIAEDVRSFGAQIVIGARSALFLPFSRLGLIIVDNEQDVFFKQTEPAPRYNARDAAVMLGRIHGAGVVLGTPAPSLESYHNALTGKYLQKECKQATARMEIIDISVERKKNGMVGPFSRKLLDAARNCKGSIAFIRGWEKPEELIAQTAELLPDVKVDIFTLPQARLADLRPYALVAVLQADALFPADDFRADERVVQALSLLREQCCGTLMVQTAKSDHPVFSSFETIYTRLLEERRNFALPPYTRLIDTDFGGKKERLTLLSDGTLAIRKQQLWERAIAFEKKSGGRARVTIDVDPIV
jgi:primosomal protein N'